MIRCVVFDFDGTLVDSNHVKTQTFYTITQCYDPNGSTVAEVLVRCSQGDRYTITREIARELMARGRLPTQPSVEAWATEWSQSYTITCKKAISNCAEVPGTSSILKWLSLQQIPLFVNSGTPTEALRQIIVLRSLAPYFSGLYGSPSTKVENLRKIQELTTTKENEILHIGDSDDDRKAAVEVGCHFGGVVLSKESRFKEAPEFKIENLEGLKRILDRI
jgi:phosphoglycolate phosphatase-like HAD superfamily hydrolase